VLTKRLEYIDFIKGFGIFLVVLGHATLPRSPYIYSFHVPLFFFISGHFFKDKPVLENLKSKLRRIYFPFVIFNVLTWLFFIIVDLLKGVQVAKHSCIDLLRTIAGIDSSVPQNGPLWFLLCLFSLSVMFMLINLIKSEYLRLIIVLALTVSGYFLSRTVTDLPFKVETAMMMATFFYAGNIFCRYGFSDKIDKLSGIAVLNTSVLLSYLNYVTNSFNLKLSGIERISVLENSYGNIFLFYLSAFFAIIFITVISKKIVRIGAVNYLGKNSLIILCLHYPVLQYVERIHPAFLGSSIFFDIISSLITVSLCVPAIYLASKFKT